MVPDDAKKFIDELTDEKLSERLSPGDAELFRRVLFDMTKDYLMLKRSPEEVLALLRNNAAFLVEDLKEILARFDFSMEDAKTVATHMAKILEDDIELRSDLDAAEEFVHGLNISEHSPTTKGVDDRLAAFRIVVQRNPRIGDVLAIMLDEEERLASLVPEEKRLVYLSRFRELYLDFLVARQSGDEWRTSPEENEFLIEYVLKFAHNFLQKDINGKKPT